MAGEKSDRGACSPWGLSPTRHCAPACVHATQVEFLTGRDVSITKGCYPGQEPIARQHYRGRVNRTLRLLELDGPQLPAYDAELAYEGKVVGRVTSAARDGDLVVALGYVRAEVPRDAELSVGARSATQLDFASPRP